MSNATVRLRVNGQAVERSVPARRSLADLLREDLGLTGTHVGCEHGVCGACTVLVDGRTARACLLLAVQLEGAEVTTVEGLTPPDGLSALQECRRRDALVGGRAGEVLQEVDVGIRVDVDQPGLAGRIDADTMRQLNNAVDGEHRAPADVAREFLLAAGLVRR